MSRTLKSKKLSMASLMAGAVMLTAAILWMTEPSQAQGGMGNEPHANPVFAREVAGTWIWTADDASATINISADGKLSWWASWFFGAPGGGFENGLVQGIWQQTGQFEIQTTEVGYLNDENGAYFAKGRVMGTYTFSPDFQSFQFEGIEEVFLANQDPTDPDEVPVDSFEFSIGPFNRLNLMN